MTCASFVSVYDADTHWTLDTQYAFNQKYGTKYFIDRKRQKSGT